MATYERLSILDRFFIDMEKHNTHMHVAAVMIYQTGTAHLILRPFLEAYRVVSDALAAEDAAEVDEERFLADCLALGRQYQLQKRICNAESVSKVFFATALRLARNRGLSDADAELAVRRRDFAGEIRETIVRIDAIEALAAGRRAGLID